MRIEDAAGRLVVGTRLSDYGGRHHERYGFVALAPDRLGLVAAPPDWRRLWICAADGNVAVATPGRRGEWLPARELEPLPLAPLVAEQPDVPYSFVFELMLRRGDEESWTPVDIVAHRPEELDPPPLPTWHKRVPEGMPWRISMIRWGRDSKRVLLRQGGG